VTARAICAKAQEGRHFSSRIGESIAAIAVAWKMLWCQACATPHRWSSLVFSC
jgi:hypothetical protein